MALTDTKIKNVKSKDKPYKLNDGEGLYLLVNPNGGRWWRFRYSFDGREKGISLGTYPDVTLQAARDKRTDARRLVASGVDPSAKRKEGKADVINTFRHVACEWFSKISYTWVPEHAGTTWRMLERDIFPFIGEKSINKIAPGDVLAALRVIESRGFAAHRACQVCGQVFRFGIASGLTAADPSMTLKDVLRKKQKEHFPSIIDPKELAVLLRAIDGYHGTFIIKHAFKLLPLVFTRPGELRHMEWTEIDFKTGLWAIPAQKMKMRQPHIVPLSRQAVEILQSLHQVTGSGRYCFPSIKTGERTMSNNTFAVVFNTLGYKNTMCAHGFRSTARTLLDEVLQFAPHLIEHQLSHTVKDTNGRAYNRTSHIEERKRMMQTWSDYLFGLKAGCKIVPFRKAA